MVIVVGLLALLVISSMIMSGWYAVVTERFFGYRRPAAPKDQPPVSILIPVRGVDGDAPGTWISFCRQEYPDYEVLFGVMDADDPAIPLLEQVVADHPGRARLFHTREKLGVNYQISNLIHLRRQARHEMLIIADSDIRVGPDYLATVTAPLADPTVGMVTCPYIARHPKSVGSALASLNRCVDFIPQILIARDLWKGLTFALGPTMATRQKVLDSFGGLEQVVNRIGSDFHLGRMTSESGYRVEFSRYVLENDGGTEGIGTVWKREQRWARTNRINKGALYYTMIFSGGLFYAVLALPFAVTVAPWLLPIALAGIATRLLQGALSALRMGAPGLLPWLLLLPVRDAMSLAIWAAGAVGNRIYWRGRVLALQPGGILKEAQ